MADIHALPDCLYSWAKDFWGDNRSLKRAVIIPVCTELADDDFRQALALSFVSAGVLYNDMW